ncbi:hypothetical protein H107_08619, partial [Trichophyton rubrum CBS 202.88]
GEGAREPAGRERAAAAGERLFRNARNREDLAQRQEDEDAGVKEIEEVKFGLAVVFSARLFFAARKRRRGSSSGGRRIGLVGGA